MFRARILVTDAFVSLEKVFKKLSVSQLGTVYMNKTALYRPS